MEDNKIVNTLLYENDGGIVSIEVIIDQENETMWASQNTIAELFGVTKQNISYHLKDIFSTGELEESSTVKKILTVQKEGLREVKRKKKHFIILQN